MTVRLPSQLNARARQLIDRVGGQLEAWDIQVHFSAEQALILDFGSNRPGTLAGGKLLAEVCLAGLGQVDWANASAESGGEPLVRVTTDFPLAACIAAQYAGWPLSSGKYFAMASGPARLLRGDEAILEEYGLTETATQAVVVLEASAVPSPDVVQEIARACRVAPSGLTICVARTASLPGSIQIVARCLETTLHKLHECRFDLRQIIAGWGSAPLAPLGANDLESIGRTNDAIIFASDVYLWVDCTDGELERLQTCLTSDTSRDFGRPFAQIFAAYDRDFYKIDKALFSPARVQINNVATGRVFRYGQLHWERWRQALESQSEN